MFFFLDKFFIGVGVALSRTHGKSLSLFPVNYLAFEMNLKHYFSTSEAYNFVYSDLVLSKHITSNMITAEQRLQLE